MLQILVPILFIIKTIVIFSQVSRYYALFYTSIPGWFHNVQEMNWYSKMCAEEFTVNQSCYRWPLTNERLGDYSVLANKRGVFQSTGWAVQCTVSFLPLLHSSLLTSSSAGSSTCLKNRKKGQKPFNIRLLWLKSSTKSRTSLVKKNPNNEIVPILEVALVVVGLCHRPFQLIYFSSTCLDSSVQWPVVRNCGESRQEAGGGWGSSQSLWQHSEGQKHELPQKHCRQGKICDRVANKNFWQWWQQLAPRGLHLPTLPWKFWHPSGAAESFWAKAQWWKWYPWASKSKVCCLYSFS